MFKGNEDSSDSDKQDTQTPLIQKSLVIDPLVSVEHLICSICFHILWEPVVCGSPTGCHNSFCSQCINSWLHKSNRLCPTCKKPFTQNDAPPILSSLLHGLRVKCINFVNGCEQKIPYNQVASHIRICGFKVLRCRGCRKNVIQRDYAEHISNCDQFIVECPKCKIKATKASMQSHSQNQCFSQQIHKVGSRLCQASESITQITSCLDRIQTLTSCLLSGQPIQMNIQLYTTFNQHFIFPHPTLIKPSFNQQKQRFEYLHFYSLNPIYTDSIISLKWSIRINKMIGNILIGLCSSMTVNSLDIVINKYGDIKKKKSYENKYRIMRKQNQGGFCFGAGDVIRFRYVSLSKTIRIWNQTKRVAISLEHHELDDLGDKIYTFYSMDTLNDSISFV